MRYIKLFESFGTGYTILDEDDEFGVIPYTGIGLWRDASGYPFTIKGGFTVMWDHRRVSYFKEKMVEINQNYVRDITNLDWSISKNKRWNINLTVEDSYIINNTYNGWDESTRPPVQLCGIRFEIIELEDEWFIVTIPTGNSENPKGAKEIIWTTYKCDQWDSVIRLFKDKVLAK